MYLNIGVYCCARRNTNVKYKQSLALITNKPDETLWDVQEGRWTHAILVLDVKQDPRLQFIRAYVKLRVVVPDLCNENEMRIRLVMNDFNDAGGIDDRCEE